MIVYGLTDPRTGEIRYVGETVRAAAVRFSQHKTTASKQTTPPVNAWIRGLLNEGSAPTLIELEAFESVQDMHDGECFWIGYMRSLGANLLNISEGGSTRTGYRHSAETRARWSRERRGEKAGNYGKRRTPEQKAMFSAITKARWQRTPHPMLGTKRSPETIAKMAAGRKGRPISAEHKAALAAGSARRWAKHREGKA